MKAATAQPRWIRNTGLGLALYALLFALYLLIQPLGESGPQLISDFVYIPVDLLAGILAVLVLWAGGKGRPRWAWGLIGLGFLCVASGDALLALSSLLLGSLPEPLPPADFFYLGAYAFFFLGLLTCPTDRLDWAGRSKRFLDVTALAIAAGLFLWYYTMASPLVSGGERDMGWIVGIAYPVADVLLIWAIVHRYFAAPVGASRRPVTWLLAGLALYVIADSTSAFLRAQNLPQPEYILDALWLTSPLLVAVGALIQHKRLNFESSPNEARYPTRKARENDIPTLSYHGQQLLPYLALLVALALTSIDMPETMPGERQWGLLAGTCLILLVMLIRQLISMREHQRLNQELYAFSRELEQRVSQRTTELAQRISEVTRVNEQVQQANQELKQLDQLKSEFISNVSHELRTPLTAILGYTELIMELSREPLSQFQLNGLQIVHGNGQRLLHLVDDLLDVSRMESGRFTISRTSLDPVPLLHQITEEVRLQVENKDLALDCHVPNNLPTICADGPRLIQVMSNLLSNAIKFTPRGGKITLSAYGLHVKKAKTVPMHDAPCLVTPALPEGKWLVVCVEDSGVGIPAAEIPRLFHRFFRASSAQTQAVQGTGLGLYVAKGIIEAHEGQIGVESQSGQGSKFWFALPIPSNGFLF